MSRKSNPAWRGENAERLTKQKRCVWCHKLNHPRYLVYTEHGWAHRLCAMATSMEPEEILEWQRKAEDCEVRDAPPTWAVIRARREVAEREKREKERQSHLAVRNFWVDSHKTVSGKPEVPGSGAYNAKYGFER